MDTALEPIGMTLASELARRGQVVEQGIPIAAVDAGVIERLALLDETGQRVPAAIEADGRDEHGRITWVRVATAVDTEPGVERGFTLATDQADRPKASLSVETADGHITVATPFYQLQFTDPGGIRLSTREGDILAGDVRFQLWPDARSIVGAGAGTCRLADFVPKGWSVEELSDSRCLVLLEGRVPKYAPYTGDPSDIDPNAQFDCELEMICYAFSPVVRLRWRIENHTVWQAYLERYCLVLPLAGGAAVSGGERSDDGKFLRHVNVTAPGGSLSMTANFTDALGDGAGISVERRCNLGDLTASKVAAFAEGGVFQPHRFLAAEADDGGGLDLVQGGVNPPHDGNMAAENPEVHRLFYLGMGRTFDGSLLVNCSQDQVEAELDPIHFRLEPDYYSSVGALPEQGDPVCFGEFKDQVFACAEWLLRKQWRQSLWWGEWWREYDIHRAQGIESTANGNNPLAPLYHYWRTGDGRFVEVGKRAMEFVYDIQLSKRRTGLGSFFHSRRFLIDKMEWVHMRYQRIEGPMKMAHFLGDRRLRTKIIDAMRTYANNLVCPNGAPGYGQGGPGGKRVPAGSDCTNFGEVLIICWHETGEEQFLEMAKKMARWTIRTMDKWDWDAYVGNSYGWHFLMRGMLQTIKATDNKRFREWYIDMARKNMTYDMSQIEFVHWMNWLIVEAEKMSGDTWMLDVLRKNTLELLLKSQPDGSTLRPCNYPWSKWPSQWEYIYSTKGVVAYIPVMAARRAALDLQ